MAGLEDLRKVVLSERETGRLTQIPPDLYDRAHAAIASLMERVYAIEDPLSDDARTLIEETVSIRETVGDLFAIRTKKSLSLAENHAQGHYIDREELKKLIPREREMFDRIITAIGACQDALVQNSSQARLTDPVGTAPSPVIHPLPEVSVAAAVAEQAATAAPSPRVQPPVQGSLDGMPVAADPAQKPPAHLKPPYALIRVLADMDTFMGVDGRTYDLSQGDVLMLPERNADVLIGRNRALLLKQ